jgi:hypothetical protein
MSEFKSAGPVSNERGRWNPYLVGAGLGVLSWLVFAIVNTPLGISTPISSAASLCAIPAMGGEAVARNAYWAKFPFQWDFLGVLLHRGGVANYNVIVNQFRFRDFTVLKIMLTAILVEGSAFGRCTAWDTRNTKSNRPIFWEWPWARRFLVHPRSSCLDSRW